MCINDCCINCMCIHVITVTSHEPWTQHRPSRQHIPFIPCILVGTTQKCEQIEKNIAIQLKKCRWPRIGGGLLRRPQLGSTYSMLRFCFVLLLLTDKAAACAAFAAGFTGQPRNWTPLNCTIECCTGDNCNNQFVTVAPPTMVYTTTPNPVSPTFESHGR